MNRVHRYLPNSGPGTTLALPPTLNLADGDMPFRLTSDPLREDVPPKSVGQMTGVSAIVFSQAANRRIQRQTDSQNNDVRNSGWGGQIRHRCQNSEAASIDVAWNETSSGKPEYAAFSACEKDRLPRNFGCRRSHSKQRQSPAQVVTRETEIRRAPLESAGLDGWTAGLNRSKIIREIDPTSCRRCLVPM